MTDPTPGPVAAGAPLTDTEDKQWASFAHLGGIIGFIPALVIWLVFKDRGPRTNVEGKEALNFQIALAIIVVAYSIVNGILTAVTFGFWALVGWIPFVLLWIFDIIWSIQGFQKVNQGGSFRYPINIRIIK